MKIRDWHKPEKIKELKASVVNDLIKKHEQRKAILAVRENDKITFTGVDSQIVLEKSIEFYTKRKSELFWFYRNELQHA